MAKERSLTAISRSLTLGEGLSLVAGSVAGSVAVVGRGCWD